MAAGRSDRLAGDKQSGPHRRALLDAGLYAPIAPACVAHGRKTAIEHGTETRCGSRGKQRERHGLHEADVDLAVDDVHVAINEARHQRAPATIDHGSILALDHRGTQLAYPTALNEQLMTDDELTIAGLKELEVAKQDLLHDRTARTSKGLFALARTRSHQLTTRTSPGRSAGKRSPAMARLASAAARSAGGWSTASLVRRKVPQWWPNARVAPHRCNASTASCGFIWLLRMNQRGS